MATTLFVADNGNSGRELWATDGTAAGTSLVKDINSSGSASSSPTDLTSLGDGRILFQANDGADGTELWVTDGSSGGTSLVKNINAGAANSAPNDITALGAGTAIFSANNGANGRELWVTNGTAAGTSLLKDINPLGGSSNPTDITSLGNGTALFEANNGANGVELWVTDGSAGGTSLVKDINAGPGNSYPLALTALGGGKAVFRADDGVHGSELWVTDGTGAGTSLLADINTGSSGGALNVPYGSNPSYVTALGNGKALFRANDGTHGNELWVTNGTAAGTALLKDISVGAGDADPRNMTVLGNGKAIFWANDVTHGNELWMTDGTGAGTSLLMDIHPGPTGSQPTFIGALGNGKALFTASDAAHGLELWVTDGTAAHTSMVTDINPGPAGSNAFGFTAIGSGEAVFSANDGSNGNQLWVTDGTAAGTSLRSDIYPGGSSYPQGFVTALCFLAGTGISTPGGVVSVEALRVGDAVLTHRGETTAIAWIGKGKVLATRGQRGASTPVIVRKGALADNVPNRDLHVTKGHSLYLDDVLIPVEFLVNHRSIVWDDQAQEVEIYHVELAAHDVLVANGAPAESYRDDGNRWLFQNANSGWHQPPKPPCAPVLTGGPVVDAIWRRLLDRSGLRNTTAEPDLHLVVDGHRVDRRALRNGVHVFRLAKPPTTLRIASRAGAQDELGLARDPRLLGVALRRITLSRGRHVKVMEADDPRLREGFHAFETDNGFRWTDGNALLPAALFDGAFGICELTLQVACTARYRLMEDQDALAA